MKRLALILVLVTIALVAVAPAAGAAGVYAAFWNPVHQSYDGFGGGFRFMNTTTRVIGFDARVSYITLPDGDTNILPVEGTALVNLGTMYVGVGYGYYFLTGKTNLNDSFGWYLLGGFSLSPGPLTAFVEFKWQNLDSGPVDLESYVWHLGLMVRN